MRALGLETHHVAGQMTSRRALTSASIACFRERCRTQSVACVGVPTMRGSSTLGSKGSLLAADAGGVAVLACSSTRDNATFSQQRGGEDEPASSTSSCEMAPTRLDRRHRRDCHVYPTQVHVCDRTVDLLASPLDGAPPARHLHTRTRGRDVVSGGAPSTARPCGTGASQLQRTQLFHGLGAGRLHLRFQGSPGYHGNDEIHPPGCSSFLYPNTPLGLNAVQAFPFFSRTASSDDFEGGGHGSGDAGREGRVSNAAQACSEVRGRQGRIPRPPWCSGRERRLHACHQRGDRQEHSWGPVCRGPSLRENYSQSHLLLLRSIPVAWLAKRPWASITASSLKSNPQGGSRTGDGCAIVRERALS